MAKSKWSLAFLITSIVIFVALVISAVVIFKGYKNISAYKTQIKQNEEQIQRETERADSLEAQLKESEANNSAIKSELEASKSEQDRLKSENDSLKNQIETLKAKKKAEAQAALNAAAQTQPQPTPAVPGSKVCYLTFDDGPSDNTLEILKILEAYNAKATFFVTASKDISYVKQIHSAGHAVGLHTATHNFKQIYSSTDAYFADLQRISDEVEAQIGIKSNIIRFPGGSSNRVSKQYCNGIMTQLSSLVTERGYSYFDWNVDSSDADAATVSYTKIVNTVLSSAKNKNSICVLMHDSLIKKTTVQALPKIIEGLTNMGFRFEVLTAESYGYHHGIIN